MLVQFTKIIFLSYQAMISFHKTSICFYLNCGGHPQESYWVIVLLPTDDHHTFVMFLYTFWSDLASDWSSSWPMSVAISPICVCCSPLASVLVLLSVLP